jgi:outer membrane protein assembly factor BamB
MGAETQGQAFQIDLDDAIRIDVPHCREALSPTPFKTPDGRRGWCVRFPGDRPIATPAFDDGMLFIGGGYGSYEFYALDARSGRVAWQHKTSDDGPTAAVVEDGLVAFNTESCSIIVCEARTGRLVWEEWLGDPLMSQPAIWDGKLYMAYPVTPRKAGLGQPSHQPPKPTRRGGHRFLCADLRTGRHLWESALTGDVMTAPVVSEGRVYLSCLDGTSYCLDATSGTVHWTEANRATCAPLVVGGRVIVTEKQSRNDRLAEGIRRRASDSGIDLDEEYLVATESAYLARDRGGGSGLSGTYSFALDGTVGFSSAPASAKLHAANAHIGVSSVSGAWAYQGSRPAYARERIYNAQGRRLHCVADGTGKPCWEAEVTGRRAGRYDQIFLPPAMGREYLYFCSMHGHLLSVRQDNGRVGLMYDTGRAMSFQPCLAQGSIYAGTAHGQVICLETGKNDADGWYMWGGNAQHNRVN